MNKKVGPLVLGAAALTLAAILVMVGIRGPGTAAARKEEPPYAPEVADQKKYAPKVRPSDFVRGVDNPYFSLKPGTTSIYEGKTEDGDEIIEDYVTRDTKTVLGVRCVVLRNKAYLDGELIEDTFDWYAQDKRGNVWYFGEDTKEYRDGEVVSTAGSWEAGKDGAKPGIVMEGRPRVGDSYRQEFYEGEAEDMAEVLSLSEEASVPRGSFSDVLMIKEWTPLEPGILEHKYYAKGVGLIAEVAVRGGKARIELVEIRAGT